MADSFIIKGKHRPQGEVQRRKLVVTGAGGKIGTYFAEHSHDRHDLLLLVHSEEKRSRLKPYGEVVACDLGDLDRLKELFAGKDTILHLGARASPTETWGPLLESNIVGTYNVFVAAEAAKCRRVVFASSIHVVSGYTSDRQVQTDDPVSPGDLYGVSKCFGEAMARFMATQHGLSAICVRIGAFQPLQKAREPESLPMMNAFVSRRDLNELLNRCIDDDRLQFAILHGLSNNWFNRMNIAEAKELVGYEPQDDFTEENPRLRDLGLREQVQPHSQQRGRPSGIRDELNRDGGRDVQ
jgi:hypothetical protein